MWLYPLPAIIAIAGWIYLFVTSGNTTLFGQSHSNMLWGAYSLIIGFPVFFIWAHRNRFWPFGEKAPAV
jgi:hypothetical protein